MTSDAKAMPPPERRQVERLHPHRVAGEPQRARAALEVGDGEHAAQPREGLLAPSDERPQHHLDVAARPELDAFRLQLAAQRLEVVELAVEDHHDATRLVDHRLRARLGEVEDGEALKAERDASRGVEQLAFVVGAAMRDRPAHGGERVGVDRATGSERPTDDAAHDSSSRPMMPDADGSAGYGESAARRSRRVRHRRRPWHRRRHRRRLARNGAAVAVNYRRSRDEAARVVAAITSEGGSAVAAPADVSDAKAAAKALQKAAEALSRPFDVLVHNAWPGWKGGAFEDVPWSTYEWYADQMLRPAVELTRAALPPMREARWGRIVMLGTSSMYELNQAHAPYIAIKGAMLALARGMARDLGPHGITVNMVSPGLVWTGEGAPPADFGDEHRGRSALARLPTAHDVAGAVVFLASPLADAITGAQLPVTCGSPMHVG